MPRASLLFLCVAVPCSQVLFALDNWPQWRGPGGSGLAEAGACPVEFSPEKGVLWKVELPGTGSSTPVVWGDRIFVTCPAEGEDSVLCLDGKGTRLWHVKLGKERPGKHRNGSGSNPTPATDGEHVFVYYKSGTVACLGLDGKVVWRTNLQEKYGEDTLWWDLGTSPVLVEDKVIIAVLQEGDSYIVALSKKTGEEVWREGRNFKCQPECDQTYSTPLVVRRGDRTQVLCWGADRLTANDAATGKPVWVCGGFNPEDKGMWRTIASPCASDGIAVVPYGRGDFLAAVKLGGEGDVTDTHRLWEKKGVGADVPTPVARDGKVYLLTDRGALHCLDIVTGKESWSAELPRGRGNFYASPILAGQRIYCVRENGAVVVGEVSSDGFRLLAENDMGERILATPVLVGGKLLLRGEKRLFCIGS